MEPESGPSFPSMPELTLSAPSPATSVEAVSAVLEALLTRFEAASARMGGIKRPPLTLLLGMFLTQNQILSLLLLVQYYLRMRAWPTWAAESADNWSSYYSGA